MKTLRTITHTVLFAALTLPLCAQQSWEQVQHARREALAAANGPGTDAVLRDKLLAMRDEDQAARFHNAKDTTAQPVATAAELNTLDRKLSDELKAVVTTSDWPTIHEVGIDASNGAMLVLTHSPDHAWQRTLLPQLETLAHDSKIDGSQLAVMVDKELVAEGKLQRYGTQFKFVDGQAMMFAVEDPTNLEQRRTDALLPPLAVYKKMLGDMYHVPVSDMIIRADAK
jgi:hypothetical protein